MYEIDYENKDEFRKLERGLICYNPLAQKDYYITYHLSKLQAGDFIDAILSDDVYEISLKTDKMFEKQCKLIFKVRDNKVILLDITPREMFLQRHNSELVAYKGILISKDTKDKDIFRINLLNRLDFQDKDHQVFFYALKPIPIIFKSFILSRPLISEEEKTLWGFQNEKDYWTNYG